MNGSESSLLRRRGLSFLRHFDLPLIAAVLGLAGIGLTAVYSATLHGAQSNLFLKQIVWVCGGAVLFLFLNLSDYRFPTDHAFSIYAAAVLSLVAVLLFGTEIHGSRSWIRFSGIGFQPSEFAKVAVVLVLARYLAGQHEDYLSKTRILALTGLALCPAVLVMMQGDLGTALTYFSILMGTMFVAGMRLRLVFQTAFLSLLSAPLAWFALKDYQQQRILATLNPSLDPQGVGYQTSQSIIAVGSSGLAGKRIRSGVPESTGLRARDSLRLCIRAPDRRVGPAGRGIDPRSVPGALPAPGLDRRPGARPVRDPDCHGCGQPDRVSRPDKRRNVSGNLSSHRDPPAPAELRRLFDNGFSPLPGAGRQRLQAPLCLFRALKRRSHCRSCQSGLSAAAQSLSFLPL